MPSGTPRSPARGRIAWSSLALLFVLLGVGVAVAVRLRPAAETTPALRGQAVARNLGCFACHGADGRGGVADPGARSGLVPAWDGPTVATYARNEAEVVEWIRDGKPARLKDVDL
ncbi:MAG: c-type cytochrome, partial [Opitutae bacterium]